MTEFLNNDLHTSKLVRQLDNDLHGIEKKNLSVARIEFENLINFHFILLFFILMLRNKL